MSAAVIRRAETADAPALAVLRWRFKVEEEEECVGIPQAEREFSAEFARWLRSGMAGPWRVWLAEADGDACGHVFLCLVEKVPSPHPHAKVLGYVTNFYVTPEQRDHGLGRALLDEVTRYARDHRLDTLVVWPSERRASLYRRCGFDGPGRTPRTARGTRLRRLPAMP
ncbi:MAG: putative acetyltransferase [Actinoallomurus sp.]|nr:putative acetyltransferase [Actinoallomurus sp.]